MTIYLIRHGKTEANEKGLYCGKTDLPLSKAGKQELVPKTLSGDFRFLSSGLRRANETLEALFGPVAYECEPELREMDFGAFEMHSYEQLKEDPAYLAWCGGNNEENLTPGGESGTLMKKRVLKAFGRIVSQGQDTVIVTHGGCIAAIMADLFPQEHKNRYQWQCANGSGYELHFSGGVWSYGQA